MIPESTWEYILTAPNTAEAVERAVSFSVTALHDSPMPWSYEELSSRARANLCAISRAHDVAITGVPPGRWSVWKSTSGDLNLSYGWEDVAVQTELEQTKEIDEEGAGNDAIEEINRDALIGLEKNDGLQSADKSRDDGSIAMKQKIDANEQRELISDGDGQNETPTVPSMTEMQAAEAVRHWALEAPHTSPPSEASGTIRQSTFACKLLTSIIKEEDAPTLRAAVIGAFSEGVGSSFANQVAKALVIPYFVTLKTPASREMMQAIVKFAELHWRASISLFDDQDTKGSINGAMAEVLVRVAAVMNTETAVQCLKAFCSRKWGEDGIRVVEALVAKCKEQEKVAALIVPSLERNVPGLEASVRFGKLLFTVTRDVPDIAMNHEQEMESILGRSKVFLAKRALKVLKEKRKQSSR